MSRQLFSVINYPRICVKYTRKGSVFVCTNIFYLDIVLSPYNHAERSESISSMTFLSFYQNCEKDDNHFLTDCPLHEEERNSFFQFISILNKTFILFTKKNKYIWLMSNEERTIITKLNAFLINAFKKKDGVLWDLSEILVQIMKSSSYLYKLLFWLHRYVYVNC